MKIITAIPEMQCYAENQRMAGRTMVLVPTMGFLHEGHMSLMRIGKQRGDVLLVSLFVNPLQFAPGEDYEDYPRDEERDREMMRSVGVDCVFMPSAQEMYPDRFQTTIHVGRITKNLCGLSRPNHFEGVATVVAKLFLAVKPHIAVFGEKDYQQLLVIKRMVKDLNIDVDIIGAPIIREDDGLARSSRNIYLSAEERASAQALNRSLREAEHLVLEGERNAARLIDHVHSILAAQKHLRIDYIKVCDAETLDDVTTIAGITVMAIAVYCGAARLIDNCLLSPKPRA